VSVYELFERASYTIFVYLVFTTTALVLLASSSQHLNPSTGPGKTTLSSCVSVHLWELIAQ